MYLPSIHITNTHYNFRIITRTLYCLLLTFKLTSNYETQVFLSNGSELNYIKYLFLQ